MLEPLVFDDFYVDSNGNRFFPHIYEGFGIPSSKDFNTVLIHLKGRLQDDLSWKDAILQAEKAIQSGYYLFWEIDLGLFSHLSHPLTHESQYLSLCLALEHFRDTLWKEFQPFSLGVSLYRGKADFSENFVWNEQQICNFEEWFKEAFPNALEWEKESGVSFSVFNEETIFLLCSNPKGHRLVSLYCRNVTIEYLTLLASRLPDSLPRYLILDASNISENLLFEAQLLDGEKFSGFHLILKGNRLPFHCLGWETPSLYGILSIEDQKCEDTPQSVKVGVCLPSSEYVHSKHYEGLEQVFHQLIARKVGFRLIPESQLVMQWDGLDTMIFVPVGLSLQGKRKLQGFCAAGGLAVSTGHLIGLDHEIDFLNFNEKQIINN